ncbi:hypothetical protein N7454_010008 [Penicillium verhagenii]|nr:hypothetical protein N7454_010008 [Penicillium verhagenii]
MAKTKSSRRKAAATPSSSGASTPSSASSGPIPPFTKVPSILEPFVKPLSSDEVYLIHIDTTNTDQKWQTYLVPLVTNIAITIAIAIRVYFGISTYPALIKAFFGFQSDLSVDEATISWFEMIVLIVRRTGTLFFDYVLLFQLLSWPIQFVLGPTHWRRAVGFQDREIIVRRSNPSWSQKLERNKWIRENEAMRDKIVAAVTPERIGKTGTLLIDDDWNLDFDAMVNAHSLVGRISRGKTDGVQLDEFRTAVLVHTDADGWLIWRVGDENTPANKKRSTQRDQIMAFQTRLTAMGKEDLFFRWVELVQWESSQPGGFTPERQKSAMAQAQKMFAEENVDFSDFWEETDGTEDVESMDS